MTSSDGFPFLSNGFLSLWYRSGYWAGVCLVCSLIPVGRRFGDSPWRPFLREGSFWPIVSHSCLSEDICSLILSLHMTVTPMAFLDGFLSSKGFFSAYSVASVWVGALLAIVCHSFHDHRPTTFVDGFLFKQRLILACSVALCLSEGLSWPTVSLLSKWGLFRPFNHSFLFCSRLVFFVLC